MKPRIPKRGLTNNKTPEPRVAETARLNFPLKAQNVTLDKKKATKLRLFRSLVKAAQQAAAAADSAREDCANLYKLLRRRRLSGRAVIPANIEQQSLLRIAWNPCYRGNAIHSFRDDGTEDVFNGSETRRARQVCPAIVRKAARRKLELLDSASTLRDLRAPPRNQLEALKKDRAGQHSIRMNDQYRVCFVWTELGPANVEIIDYQ